MQGLICHKQSGTPRTILYTLLNTTIAKHPQRRRHLMSVTVCAVPTCLRLRRPGCIPLHGGGQRGGPKLLAHQSSDLAKLAGGQVWPFPMQWSRVKPFQLQTPCHSTDSNPVQVLGCCLYYSTPRALQGLGAYDCQGAAHRFSMLQDHAQYPGLFCLAMYHCSIL